MSDETSDLLEKAFDRIRDLEDGHAQMVARHERMFRYGKILDASDIDVSDPANPVARIHHDDDDDGQPVKGPFVRYATWAGARNQHTPPSVGQQFLHISPDGEMESGILVPLGHSDDVKSPSTDGKTFVDEVGKTKNTQTDGTWQQETNNASIKLDDGKVVLTAGATVVTFEDGKVTFDTKCVKLGKNASLGVSIQGTVDNGGFVDQGPFSAILTTE